MTIKRVGLIGTGLMGTGLARLFVAHGFAVAAFDANRDALTALCRAAPDTVAASTLKAAAQDADIVIEAVSERLDIKQAVFAELAAATDGATILATNSSVIAVGAITERLNDADAARSIGTHFWNPPDLIPLVEVIQGPRTSQSTIANTMALLSAAGKEPVHVRGDVVPGNRLQHALWREAIALVEEGVCEPEDVDRIVKRSFGLRLAALGPLENADLVGLPLTAQIHSVVLPTLSRATRPLEALTARIDRGDKGVTSGAGFYKQWTEDSVTALRARLSDHLARMLDPAR